MSGFSSDVLSILKTNGLLEKEGAGLIFTETSHDARGLYEALLKDGFTVTNKRIKQVFNYDYVVIPHGYNWEALVYALSVVSVGGAVVAEAAKFWQDRYISRFGNFTATKVKYGENYYIVIRNGEDYGN